MKLAPATPPKLTISKRAALRLRQGHVWVYRSDLLSPSGIPPGSLVQVEDDRGKVLGAALYSSSSQIAVRMLGASPLAGEAELVQLVRHRVAAAVSYRKRVVGGAANAYRIIFSEADGLPGLIVDRYNNIISLQTLTQAFARDHLMQAVLDELMQQFPEEAISSVVERMDPRIRELEELPQAATRLLSGTETATQYEMNRVRFHYDALSGQKTGAFLDQRENYAAASQYAHGDALDVFCYQGGFALHLATKCSAVTAVDSSRPALEVAEENEKLNPSRPPVEWMEANAFDLLKDYSQAGRQYDTIVVDPPAFAKTKRNLETALRGYKELNLRALKMLKPGGILVTCSCSFHISASDFTEMLASASADVHRSLRVLEQRSQAKDHPIVLGIPETQYLKCLICAV